MHDAVSGDISGIWRTAQRLLNSKHKAAVSDDVESINQSIIYLLITQSHQ